MVSTATTTALTIGLNLELTGRKAKAAKLLGAVARPFLVITPMLITVTITPIAVRRPLRGVFARMQVQDLSQAAIELPEALLVLLVEKDSLDVPVIVKFLI